MICGRKGCGGLLANRTVVTREGMLEQDYCVSCGRLCDRGVVSDPYGPPRVRFTPEVEAALHERADESVSPEYAHNDDTDLPQVLRDV